MKDKIGMCVLLTALLFMTLPASSAYIDIIDVGHHNTGQWSDIEGMCGYVDYQNVVNYTVRGAILVFVDGEIVAGKIANMKIRYVAGFRCSPIKTLEFPISEVEGDHTIVVHIFSMNSSVECTYDYYAEGVEDEAEVERDNEVEEDWLKCWGECG